MILENTGRKQEMWHLKKTGLGEEFDYFYEDLFIFVYMKKFLCACMCTMCMFAEWK